MEREICIPTLTKSEVLVESPIDRVKAVAEPDRISAKLRVKITVVSDYLFVGSGRIRYTYLEDAVKRYGGEELYRNPVLLKGVEEFKEFYRAEGRPAIPGSTLKGAVRSRIELASHGPQTVATFSYGGDTVLNSLPPKGFHGWRHARIWCESIFEVRSIDRFKGYSVLENLLGYAGRGAQAIGSRVYFGTLLGTSVKLDNLVLDHNEKLEAAVKGSVFEGEIVVLGLSSAELGLLLYGLSQDKLLCKREPLMLLGASKYRCRTVVSKGGVKAEFGVVKVEIESIEPAPWCKETLNQLLGASSVSKVIKEFVEKALETYPGLRKCFDEVERKRLIEPCRV
ncbi:MAG: hypothetical protein GXO32_06385 [Crenarchaeota archaeon]|nr:hypothetical protein [Thermoproteota archaeon]